jgi:hypothetical protein
MQLETTITDAESSPGGSRGLKPSEKRHIYTGPSGPGFASHFPKNDKIYLAFDQKIGT